MRAASSQTRPRVPRGIAAPISPRASATALPATRRITRSVQKWAPPRMPADPMSGVSENLQTLSKADLDALATYIASFEPPPSSAKTAGAVAAADKTAYSITSAQQMNLQGPAGTGKAIFAAACASCHAQGGAQPFYRPVAMGLSSIVYLPGPGNFIEIVLH